MDVRKKITDILCDMGFSIDLEDDVNLIEYGMDSLRFIEFIINIEKDLDIIVPDEALLIDNISSLNGFITYIQSMIDDKMAI